MRLFSFIGAVITHFALEAGLILLVATSYMGYQRLEQYRGLSSRVEKTAGAVEKIEKLAELTDRADNRWRTFMDSGNQDVAADYNNAVTGMNAILPDFHRAFSDPAQRANAARLQSLLHDRIESANASIMHKQRALKGEAPVPVRVDDGFAANRQIHDVLADMSSREHGQMALEAKNAGNAGLEILLWIAGGIAGSFLLVFIGSIARRFALRREKKRVHELQNRSILLDTILNSMSEALIVVDDEGHFTHYNAAAQRIVGTRLRAIASDLEAVEAGFHDAEKRLPLKLKELPFHRALRGHQQDDIELFVRNPVHPDGMYVTASSRSLQNIDGRIGGALVVFKDVSRRKELEQEWIKAREAAVEASKMKSDFLAAMSHEIRTPMNGVIGMTTLLADTKLSDEQSDYVGTIQRSAQSLLRLINDILDHSKIEAGKIALDQKPFDLEFLAKDVLETFRATTREKNIGLDLTFDGVGPWSFIGDQGRLRQILVNLTGNAIKFTEKGLVNLHVSQIETIDRKRRLQFEIKDTGPGLSEAERQSLFQKYFQTGTGKRAGGTGLGLSICKQLVGLMEGEIGVESVPGVGSNFWFRINLEPCALEKVETGTARFETAFSGRVLIAEDQPVNQRVASRYLEKLGLQVDLAPNGRIASEKALSQDYDLIFMDCQMPIMTGYEATTRIRQAETDGSKRRLIVALTAEGTSGERDLCMKAGMDDFLTKPLELHALVAVLQRHLKARERLIDVDALNKLKEYFVNDQSLASVLIAEYETSAPPLIRTMMEAAESGDQQSLSEAAHAMKSNSAALGAKRLSSMCQEVEDLEDLRNAKERVVEIEIEFHKTLAELRPHSAALPKAA